MNAADIKEHMQVVGSDGEMIGTVDRVEGGYLKLTKNSAPDGQHHFLEMSKVSGVDDNAVRLAMPARVAREQWMSSPGGDGDMRGVVGI